MLNIFDSDAFTVARLTAAINNITFVPGRIGELGLFQITPTDSTIASMEKKGDVLSLIAPSQRGAAGTTLGAARSSLIPVNIPHFEINDSVIADSVQNRREFGTDGTLQTVMGKVAQRLQYAANSFSATEELARMGAVQGVITYADGTTLDLFSLFGISQAAEVDFNLDAASPASGILRTTCSGIIRTIADALGGLPFNGVRAFCGDAFFDALLAHPEVVDSYRNTSQAEILRQGAISYGGSSYGAFEFGGIVFENYRGAVGATSFVNTDKCHMFPVGVPGLFQSIYAPADYEETVNTMGERLYSRQYAMPNGKGRFLDSQMNALQICVRPQTLIKGKRT